MESESESRSVLSDSLPPHAQYSPWTSPGQNTGMGSHCLFQGIFPTQGSNIGLLHCRQILYQLSLQGSQILEWVAYPFSRRSSQPRNWTRVSCIAGRFFTSWANKGNPRILEWVAYPFSSGSSRPRNWTGVSCIAGGFFTNWAINEATNTCILYTIYKCTIVCSPYKYNMVYKWSEVKSLSRTRLFATTWIVACTKLLRPWDFQGKKYWSGLPFPSPIWYINAQLSYTHTRFI